MVEAPSGIWDQVSGISPHRSAKHRPTRPLDEVQQVPFGIAEEKHASAATGGFGQFGKLHTTFKQEVLRCLDGIDPQSEVAEAVELVVGSFLEGKVALVNLQHEPVGHAQEIGGRGLAVVVNQLGAQHAAIPLLQRRRIARRQAQMLNSEFHPADVTNGPRLQQRKAGADGRRRGGWLDAPSPRQ